MPKLHSAIYGEVSAPALFGDLLSELSDLTRLGENERFTETFLWRGQANFNWPVDSSAVRRLKGSRGIRHVNEDRVRSYENKMLQRATHQGYRHHNGRDLTDAQLLARLQHHGAATRFVDVTRNALIALYFACCTDPDQTGIILGIATDDMFGDDAVDEVRTYDEIMDAIPEGQLRSWDPPVITGRISAQRGQFIYSKVVDTPLGSIDFSDCVYELIKIAITPNLKAQCLDNLSRTFDIREFSMFPDIYGFCRIHSVGASSSVYR